MKSPRPSRVRVGVAGLAALLVLAAQPAFAQNFWTNPGSGTWTDGFNWSNSVPPNGPGNEEGRINNGGTATIDALQVDPFTGLTGQITTGSLTLGDRPGNSGNFLMASGQFFVKNTDLRIGGNPVTAIGGGVPAIGGTGVFTQTGGSVIQQGGNINIGIRGLNSMDPTVAEGTYNLSEADPLVPSSCTAQFGFIVVIGNRAKGTLNQSGGSIEVKGLTSTNGGVFGSRFQIGRNAVNGTSFTSGTYNLSGGTATAALFHFGHGALTSGSSVNTLRLSGTGKLRVAEIEFLNTTIATNVFEFTGGTLSARTVKIPVNNQGGTLSPYTIDFSTVTQSSSATITDVGTTTFSGTNGSRRHPQATLPSTLILLAMTMSISVRLGSRTPALRAGSQSVSLTPSTHRLARPLTFSRPARLPTPPPSSATLPPAITSGPMSFPAVTGRFFNSPSWPRRPLIRSGRPSIGREPLLLMTTPMASPTASNMCWVLSRKT